MDLMKPYPEIVDGLSGKGGCADSIKSGIRKCLPERKVLLLKDKVNS